MESLGAAGADILVAGSDIFQDDPKTRLVRMMRRGATLP
jgi:pentose-5-phosphate-3-epimerase